MHLGGKKSMAREIFSLRFGHLVGSWCIDSRSSNYIFTCALNCLSESQSWQQYIIADQTVCVHSISIHRTSVLEIDQYWPVVTVTYGPMPMVTLTNVGVKRWTPVFRLIICSIKYVGRHFEVPYNMRGSPELQQLPIKYWKSFLEHFLLYRVGKIQKSHTQ